MGLYQWGVDFVHIGNMKGKEGDTDYLSIVVTVIDSISKGQRAIEATHFMGGLLKTGEDVRGPWRTESIEIRDSDAVMVNFVVNQLFGGKGTSEDQFKEAKKFTNIVATDVAPIAGAFLGTILSGDPVGGLALGKEVGEKIQAGVETLIKAFLLIDNKGPDCRGEVLHDTLTYAPGEFKKAAGVPGKKVYVGPQTNPECGKAPTTEVTFSVQSVSLPAIDRQSGGYFQVNRDDKSQFPEFCLIVSQSDKIAEYTQTRRDPEGHPPLAWQPKTTISVPGSLQTEIGRKYIGVAAFQGSIFGGHNIEVIAHDAPNILRPRGAGVLRTFFQDGSRITDPSANQKFDGSIPIAIKGTEITGITGTPAWIQGTRGGPRRLSVTKFAPPIIINGNFELVVPQDQRLRHSWRDNESNDHSWNEGIDVPVPGGFRPASVALMESNFGNLELVVHLRSVTGSEDFVATYFLVPGEDVWRGPQRVEVDGKPLTGVTGQLSWVQNQDQHRGNFELVLPIDGVIQHFTRDLNTDGFPWRNGAKVPPADFATEQVIDPATGEPIPTPQIGTVEATGVSVFRSTWNSLEMVARVQTKTRSGRFLGDRLVTYSLHPEERTWNGPVDVLLFGGKGNFVSGIVGL